MRRSPGFRWVASPYGMPGDAAVGSGESTTTVVAVEVSAPFTCKRIRSFGSSHQLNSGSFTDSEAMRAVKANSGAEPFGFRNMMSSRKFFGRSSVPQSPVPRSPATAAIFTYLTLPVRIIRKLGEYIVLIRIGRHDRLGCSPTLCWSKRGLRLSRSGLWSQRHILRQGWHLGRLLCTA